MSMMDLLERLQDTWLSQTISQSTWGYPILGALHVLAIALFAGTVLVNDPASARTNYDAFFRIWKNADSDLLSVRQARAEYAQLQ